MKKVLSAALLCAVSSFATWDYFPVNPAGEGEVKLGVEYGIEGKGKQFDLNAGARFSVIEGLEIAAMFNFPLYGSYDGNSLDDFAGMEPPVIGLRYSLPMGVGIFADVAIPVDTRDGEEAALEIYPGVQYSAKITKDLEFGSELGVLIPFENGDKEKSGMDLVIGLELDYSIGMVTPFVGAEFLVALTESQFDGKNTGEKEDFGAIISIGATFEISETFEAEISAGVGIGDRWEDTPVVIGAAFSVSF